jgi:hypothetical protein
LPKPTENYGANEAEQMRFSGIRGAFFHEANCSASHSRRLTQRQPDVLTAPYFPIVDSGTNRKS